MTDVMDVCDLSSRQHAALKTVIKVTSRGKGGNGGGEDRDKVRRSLSRVILPNRVGGLGTVYGRRKETLKAVR